MSGHNSTYRFTSSLLVILLAVMSIGPVARQLCSYMDMAPVTGVVAPCSQHPSPSVPEAAHAALEVPCCTLAAPLTTEALAVTAPEAPRVLAALATAMLPDLASQEPVSALRPTPASDRPPLLHVRSHLAVSILLI